MRARDRFFLIGLGALAVLVIIYMFWVSPEQKTAKSLEAQVASSQSALTQAQQSVAAASSNKLNYANAYAALLAVGKAVPPNADVPSLIYEVDHAASAVGDVQFESIATGGGGSGSTDAAPATTTTTAASSFTPMSFTFEFSGTFFQLYHLLGKLNEFDVEGGNGNLGVSGRLLTITAATLTAKSGGPTSGTSAATSAAAPEVLNGTITATAYTLPNSGTTGASGATGTTTPSTGSTAATPAVIQANP